uniref:Small GTPase RabD1 n=1 Tax=Entamoeba histolytica TaxID=5759 RepID=Q9BLF1_ENTHI|nr:small GTPase RabD1 [Entamoeba histolytica]
MKMKLIMIGESSVGKTCCMNRFVSDQFSEVTKSTVGVGMVSKEMEVNGIKVKLQIWDTAGQERFATLSSNYFRNAMGGVIMFDVSNRQSFENVSNWIDGCNKIEEKRVLVLAGNKTDLDERVITKEEGEARAKEFGLKYFEVSAKTGVGINEMFETLTKEIVALPKAEAQNNNEEVSINLASVDKETSKKGKGGCC